MADSSNHKRWPTLRVLLSRQVRRRRSTRLAIVDVLERRVYLTAKLQDSQSSGDEATNTHADAQLGDDLTHFVDGPTDFGTHQEPQTHVSDPQAPDTNAHDVQSDEITHPDNLNPATHDDIEPTGDESHPTPEANDPPDIARAPSESVASSISASVATNPTYSTDPAPRSRSLASENNVRGSDPVIARSTPIQRIAPSTAVLVPTPGIDGATLELDFIQSESDLSAQAQIEDAIHAIVRQPDFATPKASPGSIAYSAFTGGQLRFDKLANEPIVAPDSADEPTESVTEVQAGVTPWIVTIGTIGVSLRSLRQARMRRTRSVNNRDLKLAPHDPRIA